MLNQITPTEAKARAEAALLVLKQAYAYFDAEAEVIRETPEYCAYLTAA